ncbi:MAG: hypothetical protein RR902_03025 [Oscillospiraceae bacterium]
MVELFKIYEECEKINSHIYIFNKGSYEACTIEQQGIYDICINSKKIDTISNLKTKLMHEWGHCKTGATHSVSSPFELVGKNEERANRTAIKQFIPFCEIKKAVNNGLTEYWQLAEYFNLEEVFIRKAVNYYINVCGYLL